MKDEMGNRHADEGGKRSGERLEWYAGGHDERGRFNAELSGAVAPRPPRNERVRQKPIETF